nr:MFS transporter [Pseudooceanicola algae]
MTTPQAPKGLRALGQRLGFEPGEAGLPLLVAGTLFMQNLDASVITPAIPAMAQSFGVVPVDMNVGISVYMLTVAIFIPASGWAAQRFGARRIFLISICLFTFASMLCGLSQSLPQFIAARALQGLGGRDDGAGRALRGAASDAEGPADGGHRAADLAGAAGAGTGATDRRAGGRHGQLALDLLVEPAVGCHRHSRRPAPVAAPWSRPHAPVRLAGLRDHRSGAVLRAVCGRNAGLGARRNGGWWPCWRGRGPGCWDWGIAT